MTTIVEDGRVRSGRRKYPGQRRTIFHVEIDVDLLQGDAHAGTLGVRQHDELDVGRRLVVVQLVLAGVEGNEARLGFQC